MKKVLLLGMLVVAACGKGGGPSDAEVTEAVVKVAKASQGFADLTGNTWPCGAMNAPIRDVAKVEVVQRAEKNEKEAYIPIQAKITGTCMAQFPRCGADKNSLCPPAATEFTTEKPVAFRLKKDDFGKWSAEKGGP